MSRSAPRKLETRTLRVSASTRLFARAEGQRVVVVPVEADVLADVGRAYVGAAHAHVRTVDRLPPVAAKAVLAGYHDRLAELHDAVAETEPVFREDVLADIDVVTLLTEPVADLADRWRAA